VYRGTVSGGPYTKVNAAVDSQPTFMDSGLASGTYYYVVTSVDSSGTESGFSNEVQVVIP
jgi:fibronectin type 3 domain-containing protein